MTLASGEDYRRYCGRIVDGKSSANWIFDGERKGAGRSRRGKGRLERTSPQGGISRA